MLAVVGLMVMMAVMAVVVSGAEMRRRPGEMEQKERSSEERRERREERRGKRKLKRREVNRRQNENDIHETCTEWRRTTRIRHGSTRSQSGSSSTEDDGSTADPRHQARANENRSRRSSGGTMGSCRSELRPVLGAATLNSSFAILYFQFVF